MKKLLALVIALAMVLSMASVAAATVTQTNPNAWFVMEDFGEWGDTRPEWVNVGWKYTNDFDTDSIIAIEVGILDKDGVLIEKYTADTSTAVQSNDYNPDGKNQIEFQKDSGYITADKKSSAPFYQSALYGAEGGKLEGEDWTITAGDAFAAWQPATAYVKITTEDGTQSLTNETFTGTVESAVAAKVDGVYYETLADAVAASENDGNADIELTDSSDWKSVPDTYIVRAGDSGYVAVLKKNLKQGTYLSDPTDYLANNYYVSNYDKRSQTWTVSRTAATGSSSGTTNYHVVHTNIVGQGTVEPSGNVMVRDGSSKSFTVTPAAGYEIGDVVVDHESLGAVDSFTVKSVDTDMNVEITFVKSGSAVVTGSAANPATGAAL